MLAAPVFAPAQEVATFSPPSAHPAERYEASWGKNPFVLKTAPVTPERVSFARDWIIAGCFGAEDNPIVVLANTKTRERLRLKKGEPGSNGMSLQSVTFASNRKDTVATVSLGAESAVLRFDESHLKQARSLKKPPMVAAAVRQSSPSPEGTPAPDDALVASTPRDQGAGFPYTYGTGDGVNSIANADSANQDSGRRRMLTAQKPLAGSR
ncbi:hypothetical protein DES53_11132 [Roseimicrobium gellanilyticum]|uniref:Uncharacterized protein n=1 Tax=Roseimicrobium gellanilyticum TaxID=748857 RepID=A0A366H8S8_9BACT|nr:hypothetical protein [Roseimicrobium gellanilyticum]RBP38514.1 hypothetical protein DES53_11132 [Roseimicrobium gellanilyticum]